MKYREIILNLQDNGLIDVNDHYNHIISYGKEQRSLKELKTFSKSYRISKKFMYEFEKRTKNNEDTYKQIEAPTKIVKMLGAITEKIIELKERQKNRSR